MSHNQQHCINLALDIVYAQLFGVTDELFRDHISDDDWALLLLAADECKSSLPACEVALKVLTRACKREGYFIGLQFVSKRILYLKEVAEQKVVET